MSRVKAGIQTDYVVESTTEVEVAQEDYYSDNFNFQIVGLSEFITLFQQYYPKSTDAPHKIWHNLFGNDSDGTFKKLNPDVRYLTKDSCEMILGHYRLFKESGIDFHHLPSGFFLTKNPQHGGVRDVLHFSDYLATHRPQTNPLAAILSLKPVDESFQFEHGFPPPQSQWYEYLRSHIISNDKTAYCSEKELKDAFITFSNTLKRQGLEFYPYDFGALRKDFNPIILLGRWDTLLTQPNLKKSDRESQWQQLPKLSLTKGYGALRAITDYQNTEHPCGFVLPEMFASGYNGDTEFSFIRTVEKSKKINGRLDFWRYLAYQPQRNSMEFYQKALAKIDSMNLKDAEKNKIQQILAGSTSGRGHVSKTTEEEIKELEVWNEFCHNIDNITTVSLTMQLVAKWFGGEQIKSNFIVHLNRLDEFPNIPFLHSMAECIKKHIEALTPQGVLLARGISKDPLHNLVGLSDKLNALISMYNTDFYDGARFYFVDKKWLFLDVQKYVELQYDLHQKNRHAAALLIPYLSTFQIKDLTDGNEVINSLSQVSFDVRKDLTYCLGFFKDVIEPQDKETLIKIVEDLRTRTRTYTLIPLLEYMQSNFSASFPQGYFEKKKEQLIDAQEGLSEEQKLNVHNLHLSKEQTEAIISIESAMVRKNNSITTLELEQLNETFIRLSQLITSADFTEFTTRLVSIKEYMPRNPKIFERLLTLLCQQRTLESFNQIFFRNKIEKSNNNELINKFNLFIETIKPLGKAQGTISSLNIQDLLATIVLNCSPDVFNNNFVDHINDILQTLKNISEAHPHIQQHLLDAFVHIADKNTPSYFKNVVKFTQCIRSMAQMLHSGNDEDAQQDMLTFFSILANFNQDPKSLVKLWKQVAVLEDAEQQKFFLNMVNNLVQNKQSLDGFDKLILKIKSDTRLFPILEAECAHPPYPAIKTIRQWLSENEFKAKYQTFSMRPYGKRRFDFAFNRQEFDSQKLKFIGVEPSLFTAELADTIQEKIRENRGLSVQELRQIFITLKEENPLDKDQKLTLLCACIEMLARTTAQFDQGIPPKRISQELNTTQIMALYAMLTNANHKLISEIDTGEGKSRIMMVLAACQVAHGKTVDFMTSDMPLAERDYLTYNAFFSALGIRTSLISLSTPKQLYQKDGVNFSDNSQLLLLRNKSDINLDSFAYLEEQEEKRCLLVDEVDKFQHDKSQDSYNYASKSKKLSGFIWIYPFLVDFVSQTLEENPRTKFDVENMGLTDKLVEFIAIHDKDDLHKSSIASLRKNHGAQLITWLYAAYTALHLKEDHDYKVTENTEEKLFAVRDIEGYTRYTRKVLVLDNGRPVEGSSFSDGVHQCLCAIENQKAGKEEFVIQPENATQRASYPVSFMALYDKGQTFGVSGSSRREGPSSNKAINYENIDYLRIPRQKILRREDQKIWAAKDKTQQLEFIKRSIIEKLSQNPPGSALLICKNDQQSKEIYATLIADSEFMTRVAKHKRVHGLTEKNDEVTAIAEAGEPGSLTVSTAGMFSRGVDINAEKLLVLAAYVPTLEDEIQIKGRTGRFGKLGEYRMIPDLSDPDCKLNGSTYNIYNEIDKVQKEMALNAVSQEEISKLYADFLENIHQVFLASLAKKNPVEQVKYLETWQKCLNDLQKDWDIKKEPLLVSIEEGNKNEFAMLFKKFTTRWKKNVASFVKDGQSDFNSDKSFTIYAAIQNQQGFFKPQKQAIKVQRRYDPADDGQACIYSSLFAQETAILRGERALFADFYAWREGRGALFPDFMATLRGERPLFANLRAVIAKLIAELKAWWNNNTVETPIYDSDLEPAVSSQEEELDDDYIDYGIEM